MLAIIKRYNWLFNLRPLPTQTFIKNVTHSVIHSFTHSLISDIVQFSNAISFKCLYIVYYLINTLSICCYNHDIDQVSSLISVNSFYGRKPINYCIISHIFVQCTSHGESISQSWNIVLINRLVWYFTLENKSDRCLKYKIGLFVLIVSYKSVVLLINIGFFHNFNYLMNRWNFNLL